MVLRTAIDWLVGWLVRNVRNVRPWWQRPNCVGLEFRNGSNGSGLGKRPGLVEGAFESCDVWAR